MFSLELVVDPTSSFTTSSVAYAIVEIRAAVVEDESKWIRVLPVLVSEYTALEILRSRDYPFVDISIGMYTSVELYLAIRRQEKAPQGGSSNVFPLFREEQAKVRPSQFSGLN